MPFDPNLCDECEERPHRVQRGAIRYCRECDPQAVRRPDPVAESERRRLAEETAAAMRRAEEQSRVEAAENERREEKAPQSRHPRRLSTATPIVHPAPPVAPQVPRPAPVAATVAPAVPEPPVEAVEPREPAPPRKRRPSVRLKILPVDQRIPGQCVCAGCTSTKIRSRGLCKSHHNAAVKAKVLDALPTAPRPPRPDPVRAKVAAFIAENPGQTIAEIAGALGLLTTTVAKYVWVFRCDGRVAPSNGNLRGHDARVWPAGMAPKVARLRDVILLRIHDGGVVTSSDLHAISPGAPQQLRRLRDNGLIFSPAYNQNSLTADGRKLAAELLNKQG